MNRYKYETICIHKLIPVTCIKLCNNLLKCSEYWSDLVCSNKPNSCVLNKLPCIINDTARFNRGMGICIGWPARPVALADISLCTRQFQAVQQTFIEFVLFIRSHMKWGAFKCLLILKPSPVVFVTPLASQPLDGIHSVHRLRQIGLELGKWREI